MGNINNKGRKHLQVTISEEAWDVMSKCQAKLEQRDRLDWKHNRVVHLAMNVLADTLGIEFEPKETEDGR